jgi:hypothetical protein
LIHRRKLPSEAARQSAIASTLSRLPIDKPAMATNAITRTYHACIV